MSSFVRVRDAIVVGGLLLLAVGCADPLPPVPDQIEIQLTGEKFEWEVRYPGADGIQGTADDFFDQQNLTLAHGVPTKLHLCSKDYLYGLELPDFDQSEIAVPDLEFAIEFVPDQSGIFPLRGHQMCGFIHPKLLGTLEVVPTEDFAKWSARMSTHRN